MAPPARVGLSVVHRNQAAIDPVEGKVPLRHRRAATHAKGPAVLAQRCQNVVVAEAGRLSRQHGASNLLKGSDSKDDDKVSENAVPSDAYKPRSIVPKIQSTFEVLCDDDENNIIHQLEKQCREKDSSRKAMEKLKPSSGAGRKPLSSLPVSSVDSVSDDEDFLSADSNLQSESNNIRSEFSSFDVNDEDDAKSSQYGSALDFELDSRDEYVTAISEKEICEDIIYANAEFSNNIYTYMRSREIKVRPKRNYMSKQDDINPEMRAVLIDWLSDVRQEYRMHQETLHLAVALVDRTLSKFRANRDRLQLIGTAAMMIASKYEEIFPPELKEFVYVTDASYTAEQILKMERVILYELEFEVGTPTSQWFGGRLARYQKASRRTINAMNMLLDLVLLEIGYLNYRPSYIAAACLCYANVLTGPVPWSAEMECWSGISVADIANLLRAIHCTFTSLPSLKLRSIPQLYSSPEFDHVADLPPPARLPL